MTITHPEAVSGIACYVSTASQSFATNFRSFQSYALPWLIFFIAALLATVLYRLHNANKRLTRLTAEIEVLRARLDTTSRYMEHQARALTQKSRVLSKQEKLQDQAQQAVAEKEQLLGAIRRKDGILAAKVKKILMLQRVITGLEDAQAAFPGKLRALANKHQALMRSELLLQDAQQLLATKDCIIAAKHEDTEALQRAVTGLEAALTIAAACSTKTKQPTDDSLFLLNENEDRITQEGERFDIQRTLAGTLEKRMTQIAKSKRDGDIAKRKAIAEVSIDHEKLSKQVIMETQQQSDALVEGRKRLWIKRVALLLQICPFPSYEEAITMPAGKETWYKSWQESIHKWEDEALQDLRFVPNPSLKTGGEMVRFTDAWRGHVLFGARNRYDPYPPPRDQSWKWTSGVVPAQISLEEVFWPDEPSKWTRLPVINKLGKRRLRN